MGMWGKAEAARTGAGRRRGAGNRTGTGRYLAGAVAARTGDAMCGPALLLAGLAVTGSLVAASVLTGGLLVSAAVGGPVFGAVLDRAERPGRVLAGALAGFAAALAVILAGLGRVPLAGVAAVAVPAGLLGPALSGGWTAQLPLVAAAAALPRATALDAMTYDVAGLIGPAVAGMVAGLVGASWAVIAAATLIGLAAPVAATLPTLPTLPKQTRPPGGPPRRSLPAVLTPDLPAGLVTGLAADVAAGFRAIGGSRPLRRATVVTVVSCLGEGMFVTCCPLLGARCLGGADRGAILLSVVAVFGIAANTVLVRHPAALRPDTVIGLSAAAIAGAVLLTATGAPLLVIAGAALVGAAEGPQLTALFTVRHREAPGHLRSQVFTTGASLKTTAYALGAPLAGVLAAHSLAAALLVIAAVQAAAAYISFAMRKGAAIQDTTTQDTTPTREDQHHGAGL